MLSLYRYFVYLHSVINIVVIFSRKKVVKVDN